MPISKPRQGESQDDFVSRCMADDVMNKEYPDQKQRAGVCYTQWREKKYSEFIENKTYDINDVEIFAAGKWNGDEYFEKDLDDIVKSFEKLKGRIKPALKLGHDKDQKLLQKDGYPAIGWITNLKKVGKKLLADIKAIPAKIKELIDRKAYGRFSSEIYWGLQIDDKKYKRVLKDVSLLGVDIPAVDLDDFINLYSDFSECDDLKIYENKLEYDELKTYNKLEDDKMSDELIKNLQDQLKEYSEKEIEHGKEIIEFKQTVDDLEGQVKELTEKIETKDEELKKIEQDSKMVEVKAYIDSKVKEGKITPAQIEQYTKLAESNFEEVKTIVDNMPTFIELDEKSQSEPKKKKYTEMTEEEKDDFIANKAMEYAKENNVTYKEALNETLKQYDIPYSKETIEDED